MSSWPGAPWAVLDDADRDGTRTVTWFECVPEPLA
jgi:hypothetical protein